MTKPTKTTTGLAGGLLLIAAGLAHAQDYSIDWYTIDSGGVMQSESADGQWQLSGTIGQWDATEARASSSDDWDLTGGFWGLTLEERTTCCFGIGSKRNRVNLRLLVCWSVAQLISDRNRFSTDGASPSGTARLSNPFPAAFNFLTKRISAVTK